MRSYPPDYRSACRSARWPHPPQPHSGGRCVRFDVGNQRSPRRSLRASQYTRCHLGGEPPCDRDGSRWATLTMQLLEGVPPPQRGGVVPPPACPTWLAFRRFIAPHVEARGRSSLRSWASLWRVLHREPAPRFVTWGSLLGTFTIADFSMRTEGRQAPGNFSFTLWNTKLFV